MRLSNNILMKNSIINSLNSQLLSADNAVDYKIEDGVNNLPSSSSSTALFNKDTLFKKSSSFDLPLNCVTSTTLQNAAIIKTNSSKKNCIKILNRLKASFKNLTNISSKRKLQYLLFFKSIHYSNLCKHSIKQPISTYLIYLYFFINLIGVLFIQPVIAQSNIAQTTLNLNNSLKLLPNLNFNEDCSDYRFKTIRCHVTFVNCHDVPLKTLTSLTFAEKIKTPRPPHDIRIEPFAKALSVRSSHQLTVDISWQTSPINSTKLLSGFLIKISEADKPKDDVICFLFQFTESNWTEKVILFSPRLHFLTSGIFQFSKTYNVTLLSLPAIKDSASAAVHERFVAPNNPHVQETNEINKKIESQFDETKKNSNNHNSSIHDVTNNRLNNNGKKIKSTFVSQNCTKFSNPYASKWTAGFRRIFLHSITRSIQVEFIGAPPQYCFEQYEVRLLDETATELLHSGLLSVLEMKTEVIDNTTVLFGEYNFTGLELDFNYIPSVIPVERAHDGRCLCPVYGFDPYDNKVICSCIAADWKPVRLNRLTIVQSDCTTCNLSSSNANKEQNTIPSEWPYFISFNVIFIGITIWSGICVFINYKRQENKDCTLLNNTSLVNSVFVDGKQRNNNSKNGQHFGPSISSFQTPLIDKNTQITVLLIYSHDSSEHTSAVLALAELLRDVFDIQVGLDKWDEPIIEQNMINYLSTSVINADKVIIINSIGALHRFYCKIANENADGKRYVVERNPVSSLDSLFLNQIDLVFQHHCIISARFTGTPHSEIIPILAGRLQYVVPDNLAPLLSAILGYNVRHDPRLSHPHAKRLAEAVQLLSAKLCNDPDWFVKTHHRRPILSTSKLTTAMLQNKKNIWNNNKNDLLLSNSSNNLILELMSSVSETSENLPKQDLINSEKLIDENLIVFSVELNLPDFKPSVESQDIQTIKSNYANENFDSKMIPEVHSEAEQIDNVVTAYSSKSEPSSQIVLALPVQLPNANAKIFNDKFENTTTQQNCNSAQNFSSSLIKNSSIEENYNAIKHKEQLTVPADSGVFTDTFNQTVSANNLVKKQAIKNKLHNKIIDLQSSTFLLTNGNKPSDKSTEKSPFCTELNFAKLPSQDNKITNINQGILNDKSSSKKTAKRHQNRKQNAKNVKQHKSIMNGINNNIYKTHYENNDSEISGLIDEEGNNKFVSISS